MAFAIRSRRAVTTTYCCDARIRSGCNKERRRPRLGRIARCAATPNSTGSPRTRASRPLVCEGSRRRSLAFLRSTLAAGFVCASSSLYYREPDRWRALVKSIDASCMSSPRLLCPSPETDLKRAGWYCRNGLLDQFMPSFGFASRSCVYLRSARSLTFFQCIVAHTKAELMVFILKP